MWTAIWDVWYGFCKKFCEVGAIFLSSVSTRPSKEIGWLRSWGLLVPDKSLSSLKYLTDGILLLQSRNLPCITRYSFDSGPFLLIFQNFNRDSGIRGVSLSCFTSLYQQCPCMFCEPWSEILGLSAGSCGRYSRRWSMRWILLKAISVSAVKVVQVAFL